jgi:hypothetical protein
MEGSMSLFKKSNSKASSRRQIAIKGVDDGVLLLPSGHYATILQVSSINLELKSEAEQDAIIEMYQSFLNSLACPIQVLVRIRELDVDKYLDDYRARLADEQEEVYKKQIEAYIKFVRELIKTNKILTRYFYIVVPYADNNKASMGLIKDQLALHVGIVEHGLEKLGMQSRQLTSLEALDMFYGFYNPDQAKLQPLTAQTMQMLTTQYV